MIEKLKDYIIQVRGVSYKPSDASDVELDGYVPLLRANNIKDNKINYNDLIYVKATKVKASQYLKKGDILICTSSGSKELVGKAGMITNDTLATFGAFCKVIRVKENIMDSYIAHYFNSNNYKNSIKKKSNGANINNLRTEDFDSLDINIISKDQQLIIASKLDIISSVLNKRKKQIEHLDELIKSQFVEMFGYLSENTNQWNELSISEILNGDLNNGYFAKRDEYVDNGNAEIIGVASVVNRMYSNIDNLPTTNASEKDIEKYRVKYGDLLFCRSSLVAEGIGKASIVPKNVKHNQLFECHVIRMHLNLKKCVPEYIQKLTEDDYFRNQIMKGAKTATMTTIGQGDILKCKVLLPPLDLQNKFADFVKVIDKQKFEMQKSLEEMQNLYESLMNQYFGQED